MPERKIHKIYSPSPLSWQSFGETKETPKVGGFGPKHHSPTLPSFGREIWMPIASYCVRLWECGTLSGHRIHEDPIYALISTLGACFLVKIGTCICSSAAVRKTHDQQMSRPKCQPPTPVSISEIYMQKAKLRLQTRSRIFKHMQQRFSSNCSEWVIHSNTSPVVRHRVQRVCFKTYHPIILRLSNNSVADIFWWVWFWKN